MTATSPYLEQLLAQWTDQASHLRNESGFQKSLVDPLTLTTHGNYLAKGERRRRGLSQVSQLIQDSEARWDERLRRIAEWQAKLSRIQAHQDRLRGLLGASAWLKKAREHQDAILRRLQTGSERLEISYQVLHNKLAAWLEVLKGHEQAVYELVSKSQMAQGPFFVSRARKQPEVNFINEQLAGQAALGQDLQGARHLLNHLRARLKRAYQVIEERAAGAELFYEIHKQELVAAINAMEKILDLRREEILSEALVFEGGRHLLRKLNEVIQRLPLLEEIPQPKRGFFRR